ncbi:MAG: DNA polymerase III subunit alpha [Candidatus Pacebacteria bacterium]|nr:DNA polymerase III subunit alpha [Candidatus Paceibacterota bacterium]
MADTKLNADFIHLHTHGHYSLLNALPTSSELVDAANADTMPALALTDAGALYGAVDFYKACTKGGIKAIIGVDAYLAPRTRHDKDGRLDKPRGRVVFLAKNNDGYVNLIKMVTESWVNGFYYKPRIDHELIEQYHQDLICIIPSFSGESTLALKDGDTEKAGEVLDWYKSIFKDDCHLEVTHHPEIGDHEELQEKIIALGKASNTPLVAAHDVYYLKPEDALARDVVMKIQNGGVVDTLGGAGEEDFSFITQAKAKELFANTPEALANTVKIAEQCNVTMTPGEVWHFPNYIIESGREPDDELRITSYEGMAWRGLDPEDPEVKARLDYELDVIKTKGYAKYFLVVGDLIREARERGILTTIRGSVAGSLTTYVLGITNVDPLDYKLPFERFLNPERPSAPDIDMDFADNRRDEIIAYAREKYGDDKVAQIGTFGTMMARAAVRDTARALGHPYATGDRIAKLIPMGSQGFAMTIDRALDMEPELAELYKKDAETREVIDLAKQIEGRARHLGVHAAGVVIAPEPLGEFTPVQIDTKSGKIITQYEMHSVGEDGVGLLKFDFLGIKNLAILADAVKRVKKIRDIDIDIENIPLDDQKTFDMLARGETMGLFQLNGSGMTAFLKQLRPTTIHDINAMVALYRPGPMESIPQYIERKHNPTLVTYLDPRLEEVLDRSYGVITYQDDVMMISIKLAGYSWLDADKLRKAMGKKVPEIMEAEKEKLMVGFADHGKISPTIANKLWALIEPFAAYGFNKAHAASYGRVAYQTSYMKANFPEEYMSAVLTADSGDTEKISEIIHECERMGIEVLPPDINESFGPFSVVPASKTVIQASATEPDVGNPGTDSQVEATSSTTDSPEKSQMRGSDENRSEPYQVYGEGDSESGTKQVGEFQENQARIRFGLTTIKNFGEGITEAIIDERKANGPFTSLTDFLTRVIDKNLNKKSLEALIMAGALDSIGDERGKMLHNLDTMLAFNKEKSTAAESSQDSLFGMMNDATLHEVTLEDAAPASKRDMLIWEKELLGVYVSGHPLDEYPDELKKRPSIAQTLESYKGASVVTAGMIESVRELLTKKGDHMAFVVLGDQTHTIEMVTFPETYKTHKELLEPGTCVAVKGKFTVRNDEPGIMVDKIKKLVPSSIETK